MDLAAAAELQTLLEGVPLPAGKRELLAYAARQQPHARQLAALRGLPDRSYETIDAVGEELVPVQPPRRHELRHEPREESAEPPGGDAYVETRSESGAVRP